MAQGVRLILASTSPRRRELLAGMGYAFETCAPDVDERADGAPREMVAALARRKALAAAELYADGVILASDTLVSLDDAPLGKPADEADAARMLRALSGREHFVFTGVCLLDAATGRVMVRTAATGVRFRPLSEEEIAAYVATGEPMDKAGAYGIQGGAGAFVEGLDGSYSNVMGLPVELVGQMIGEFCGAQD